MIVLNQPFPETCLNCAVRALVGCEIAIDRGKPDDCPFESAFPVSSSEEVAGGDICEMVCLMCLNRFVAFKPESVLMKTMICPGCGKAGYLIETGEYMREALDADSEH